MSRQPQELVGYAALIVSAFSMCDITTNKLHVYYLEELFKEGLSAGRGDGQPAFRQWMAGTSEPTGTRLALLCRAMNRRLVEVGREPVMPDIPFRFYLPGDGDDGGQPVRNSPYVSYFRFSSRGVERQGGLLVA